MFERETTGRQYIAIRNDGETMDLTLCYGQRNARIFRCERLLQERLYASPV